VGFSFHFLVTNPVIEQLTCKGQVVDPIHIVVRVMSVVPNAGKLHRMKDKGDIMGRKFHIGEDASDLRYTAHPNAHVPILWVPLIEDAGRVHHKVSIFHDFLLRLLD
jgi:hypothetical protein